jgi:hypothetical protein
MRNNSRENPSHTMIANARAVLRGIERLTDYAPANPSFSLAALQLLERSLSEAERRLEDLQHMLDLARNALLLGAPGVLQRRPERQAAGGRAVRRRLHGHGGDRPDAPLGAQAHEARARRVEPGGVAPG